MKKLIITLALYLFRMWFFHTDFKVCIRKKTLTIYLFKMEAVSTIF